MHRTEDEMPGLSVVACGGGIACRLEVFRERLYGFLRMAVLAVLLIVLVGVVFRPQANSAMRTNETNEFELLRGAAIEIVFGAAGTMACLAVVAECGCGHFTLKVVEVWGSDLCNSQWLGSGSSVDRHDAANYDPWGRDAILGLAALRTDCGDSLVIRKDDRNNCFNAVMAGACVNLLLKKKKK